MPFLAVGLTLWWINAVHGETRVYAEKARDVYLLLAVSDYVWEQLSPLLHLGLVLCPLAWGVWGALPIALSGTIDEFRYLRAVADARAWLLRQGVVPKHIDAGYALNGWWLYAAAPPGLPAGRARA